MRPYMAFESKLESSLQHPLPQFELPPDLEHTQFPLPYVVFRIFDTQVLKEVMVPIVSSPAVTMVTLSSVTMVTPSSVTMATPTPGCAKPTGGAQAAPVQQH